jgi:UDP-N-acetyl-D-glucosamine/UDP-N-acetyl-D-galactosamine dehydrogenase
VFQSYVFISLPGMKQQPVIAVIGLGYVGLPLAAAFSARYRVIGYDINKERVNQLNTGLDATHEVSPEVLKGAINATNSSVGLTLTHNPNHLSEATIFIVTVPTPLTTGNLPDLSFLTAASELVGKYIRPEGIVVYESTVYPGCTEEVCVPVVEEFSGLVFNKDFFVGYSPERINPGDVLRPLQSIVKVVSGSTPEVTNELANLYRSIITAGVFAASSIKVAEAAKAIENAQRDVNISFMNELALLFDALQIDTQEVLAAARTKWNFLPYSPGLVGGHCISVDPHYLAFKAKAVGYEPHVILSGRAVNEKMGVFVAQKIVAALATKFNENVANKTVLIAGFSFKENCPDTRNTKVIDIYTTLAAAGLQVLVFDPVVDAEMVQKAFDVKLTDHNNLATNYDAIILAVPHEQILATISFESYKNAGSFIYDVKGVLPKAIVDGRL